MKGQLEIILKRYAEEIEKQDTKDDLSAKENVEKKIETYNELVQSEAEKQKIQLREKLTKTVVAFIWIQIIFFNIVVLLIVFSVTVKVDWFKDIDNELASLLFNFLKYYISATIAELLGMLVFILHFVFSEFKFKSIKEFFKDKKSR